MLKCITSFQVVNLISYGLKFWGATANRKELLAASARLAAARASMRLYDDALALKTAAKYGWGIQVLIINYSCSYCSR